jgi:hypothetical protein
MAFVVNLLTSVTLRENLYARTGFFLLPVLTYRSALIEAGGVKTGGVVSGAA